jgi:formylglycine-generating enzyme required for sulfatase activity
VYRLPDKWKWEAAAAGRDGRKYPWGDWEDDRCNSEEAVIEKTSPVGIFAKGDTPEGVCDMSGNVREWTMSSYHSGRKPDDFRFDQEIQSLYDKIRSEFVRSNTLLARIPKIFVVGHKAQRAQQQTGE